MVPPDPRHDLSRAYVPLTLAISVLIFSISTTIGIWRQRDRDMARTRELVDLVAQRALADRDDMERRLVAVEIWKARIDERLQKQNAKANGKQNGKQNGNTQRAAAPGAAVPSAFRGLPDRPISAYTVGTYRPKE